MNACTRGHRNRDSAEASAVESVGSIWLVAWMSKATTKSGMSATIAQSKTRARSQTANVVGCPRYMDPLLRPRVCSFIDDYDAGIWTALTCPCLTHVQSGFARSPAGGNIWKYIAMTIGAKTIAL
jgi:hypothetical protein